MKSFRLCAPEPPPTLPLPPAPARVASDFSAEEMAVLAKTFIPVLERYHKHRRITLGILHVLMPCWFAIVIFSKSLGNAVDFVAPACFLLIVTMIIFPRLPDCPGCLKRPHTPFGQFCPECGSRSLLPSGWSYVSNCRACKRTIQWRKGRRFKVCHCTHCGLHLDKDGF